MSGCRKRTPSPISRNPAAVAGSAATPASPSRSAARHSSAASPTGSAAATSSRRRLSSGSASSCRVKLSSMRFARGIAPAGPKPPASSPGVRPRGSSSNARGLPRASLTMRSRSRTSSGPWIAEASSLRASASPSPPTSSRGSPARSSPSLGSRTAKTMPTGSASRRRATKARVCAEARSCHWASSITQSNGRSSATSERRLSTARPTRKRSGASSPTVRPSAAPSASRCGPGSRSRRSSIGAQS